MIWQERADGYFFPRENLSAAVQAKLEMLSLEDAELLSLPPRNPYQMSIRTENYIGAKNFKYVVNFPVDNFKINGALLHVGKNIFRLNAEQFALINLVELGNKNLSREETYLTVKKIQQHAKTAKLDDYISEANKKIIVPEKLDVDFQESGDAVKVAPVLLENRDGILKPIDSADFQGVFDKRNKISGVYRGRNAQYIFTETLRDGLAQIKSVGKLSKAAAARYKIQPKELFSGTAFDFNYSDRVIGVEEITIGAYQNFNIFKTDWGEGTLFPAPPKDSTPRKIFALKIKENTERNIYKKDLIARHGKFYIDVLRAGVKLFDYQLFGVWWMSQLWQDGWRGILIADDMGLGKTLQTLTFIGGLKKFKAINQPVLIVTPTALLTTWQAEYKKFLCGNIFDKVISLHGDGLKNFRTDKKLSLRKLPPNCLALTTYETLRDYQFSFAEISWSVIIADEAQKIKNPETGISKALKAMKYDFAICLSGTPVENSWVDLWSIMDFVQPAHLDDLKTFKAKYIDCLTGENIQKLGEDLKKSLEPLILRRLKDDYLHELPAKKIFLCPQEMPSYQSKIYSAVLEKYRRGGFSTALDFLRELREVSLHPDLGTMPLEKFFALDAEEIINRSARLIKTFALLDQIKNRGEKVLIFVTSRNMQLILKRLLEKMFGIKILPPINGTMNGAARQRFIDEFKSFGGFNVLILSTEAAGVGFTITAANNVIHLSRTWNPAKENQATDRVYRIGQEKVVNVYLPLTCDKNLGGKTFDENLDALLNYKKILGANVLFPTAETAADIKTLADILKPPDDEILDADYWTLAEVDEVTGLAFEKIIADLFNGMKNFSAIKTPDTNDFGADVVVKSSAGVIELAKKNSVRLIVRRELEELLTVNKVLRC